MGNPFKTPQFKKLFRKWNNILEETGHNEIENFSGEEPTLKKHDAIKWCDRTRWRSDIQCDATFSYFEAAEELLNTYSFKNKLEKRIWLLHSEGYSIRKIVKMINRAGYRRDKVCCIIAKIARDSGLKRG